FLVILFVFFFSSRRRHTRFSRDWSSDVCSSDLVIRAITNPMDGAIAGTIYPPSATPAVYAIAGIDTVGSVYTDDAGRFLIRGLAAGTYTVAVSPNEQFDSKTFDDVNVSVGLITDLGTISLSE